MTRYVKYLLQNNMDLVDNNQFTKLYDELGKFNATELGDASDLTSVLEGVDIDPLQFMTKVPKGMFFGRSDIVSFELPSGIIMIDEASFGGCYKLERVTLPKSLTEIKQDAFVYCNKLCQFIYDGTVSEWERIIFDTDHFIKASRIKRLEVKCIDGIKNIQ